MSATQTDAGRHPVVAYATLVRLPNLFTAPPDVVLGAALASVAVDGVSVVGVAGLALASVLLYAAGTTLNDYADAEEDARERPGRPIPSGDVSRRVALFVGVVLLTTGVGVAVVAGGAVGGTTAGALALAVLLYDGVFKGSAAGFLFRGASRGLNVLLGVAAAGVAPTELPAWALVFPALVVLYIAGDRRRDRRRAGRRRASVHSPTVSRRDRYRGRSPGGVSRPNRPGAVGGVRRSRARRRRPGRRRLRVGVDRPRRGGRRDRRRGVGARDGRVRRPRRRSLSRVRRELMTGRRGTRRGRASPALTLAYARV
jgi:4-hydroxybenzoate polyprenyltransferase